MTQTITMQEYNKILSILWENIEYKRNGTIPISINIINRRWNCTCGSIVKNIKEHLKTPKHERHIAYLREINNRCHYEAPPDSEDEDEDEQEEIKKHYEENEKYQEEKKQKYQEEKKQQEEQEEKKQQEEQEEQEEQAIGPNQ